MGNTSSSEPNAAHLQGRLHRLALLGALVLLAVAWVQAASADADPSDFGLASTGATLSTHQAGAVLDLETRFRIAGNPAVEEAGQQSPWATLRDLSVELPPGLVGNLRALPTCSAATFVGQVGAPPEAGGPKCPADSQVGVISPGLTGLVAFPPGIYKSPLFNLERPPGNRNVLARLGAVALFDPMFVDIRLDPKRGYALTVSLVNAPSLMTQITGANTTLWGVPADSSHDDERFDWTEAIACDGPCSGPVSSTLEHVALLANPTQCGNGVFGFVATTYADSEGGDYGYSPFDLVGCDAVPFAPELGVGPTTRSAAAPSGIDVHLHLSQQAFADPSALRMADIRKAAVTLPEGVSINPSVADGIGTCSEAQVGLDPNERQIVDVGGARGPVTLAFSGESTEQLPDGATASEVETALQALPRLRNATVSVAGRRGGPWQVDFGGSEAGVDVPAIAGVHSEVEMLAVRASGGTYSLSFEGRSTVPIPFDASAAAVRSALEGTGLTASGVAVGGGPDGGGFVYRIVFGGDLTGATVPQIAAASGLSGAGSFAKTYLLAAGGSPIATRTVEQGGSLRFDGAPPRCPDASKIASGEISSPLLANPLDASVFLADRQDTPFDSPYGLYLVADSDGIQIKIAGHVEFDPATGRVVIAFEEVPQLPIEDLELRFKSGNRAIVTTPRECGDYRSSWRITPWSGEAPATGTSTFRIDRSCVADAAPPRFDAGSSSGVAGAFTDFAMRLERSASSPRITAVSMLMPPGLSANLAEVDRCPEEDLSAAPAGQVGPVPEGPLCPASTRVGSATAGVGSGSPFYVEAGPVFLAGPYRGAPLSLVAEADLVSGPFDLGPAVVRIAVYVDPRSARIRLVSGPLPTVADGLPIEFRDLRVSLDRPGFVLNPTDCRETSVDATVERASMPAAEVSDRFEVGSCADLGFRPIARFRAAGAVGRNGHPTIAVELRTRSGDADVAAAAFTLPTDELLDLRHVRSMCAADVPPQECPGASVVGRATLWSRLVGDPLSGRIYVRAPSGKLPNFVGDLRGDGFHLLVRGQTVASPEGLRLRFPDLPDLPFARALFSFRGGRRGLVVNSQSLCRGRRERLSAAVDLTAHSGRGLHFQVPFRPVSDC
jgi:hypothetical protein